MSALEALCNAVVGLIASYSATFFILGYTASGSAAVTLMFFTLSFVRSWAIRVAFARWANV